ncbi:MAG: hypothetical protein LBH16_09855 [Treponema sp.]|jgi:hypothetical protein|nr:hypothetical protein [Treponema sp.]
MTEQKEKWERVQYELMEISVEMTAMGDMIQGLFLNEEMETVTPKGVKILMMGIGKRLDDLRKYVGGKVD